MFVCTDCLKVGQQWRARISASRGQCEVCNSDGVCADVPSGLVNSVIVDRSTTTDKQMHLGDTKEGSLTTKTVRTVYRGVALTVCIKQPFPNATIPAHRWVLNSAETAHHDAVHELLTIPQQDELTKQVLEESKED